MQRYEDSPTGREDVGWFQKYMIRNDPLSNKAGFYFSSIAAAALGVYWGLLELYNAANYSSAPNQMRTIAAIGVFGFAAAAGIYHRRMKRNRQA